VISTHRTDQAALKWNNQQPQAMKLRYATVTVSPAMISPMPGRNRTRKRAVVGTGLLHFPVRPTGSDPLF